MTEMVFGRDFTVSQIQFNRGSNFHECRGKHGRGRPKGSKNRVKRGELK
jgi:hypothetical protein